MGNREIGPRDKPSFWVVLCVGNEVWPGWVASGIYTSKTAALHGAGELIKKVLDNPYEYLPDDVVETSQKGLKYLRKVLASGDTQKLLEEWRDRMNIYLRIEEVAVNKDIEPNEWW